MKNSDEPCWDIAPCDPEGRWLCMHHADCGVCGDTGILYSSEEVGIAQMMMEDDWEKYKVPCSGCKGDKK